VIYFKLSAALLLTTFAAFGELDLTAPNPTFPPVNQLKVSGNACGPAALLNAFGLGSRKWQEVGRAVPGSTDRTRLTYLIRAYGLKQSQHLDRLRWTKTRGVNLLDLTDMANEMRGSRWLSKISNEVFVKDNKESDAKLIRRIHSRLTYSMKKGFPPIVSLQRLAEPAKQESNALSWRLVHGHFIVLTALPSKLDSNATSFPFRYVDPWEGKILEGTVLLDPNCSYPAALVSVPQTDVGKRHLKSGEQSVISLAAALGSF
jgi:hypothetical protein